MYTPNLVPRDVHHLWLKPAKKQTITSESKSSTKQSPHGDLMTQIYAPTLSSYSAAFPGAHLPNLTDGSIPADIQEKINRLNSIKTLGLTYLKPLGLNKTMQNLIDEEEFAGQLDEEDNASYIPTAENLLNEPHTNNPNLPNINNTNNTNNTGIMAEGTINNDGGMVELDLDAAIPDEDNSDFDYDLDEQEIYDNTDLDDNIIDEDEGFMAADEEYQDDHSISAESNSMNNFSGLAPITSTTIPTSTTGNTHYSQNAVVTNAINSGQSNASLANYRSFSSPNVNSNLRREYVAVDVTVNVPDLDMMIDDD